MMEYMYRGEVNISQDQLGAFLKAAESLQIKGLTDNSGVNKKINDAAILSDSSPEEEVTPLPIPSSGLQPRKIDDLLAQATKKCAKKYTSPPNMFQAPERSPLQNMNAITPPLYPPPSYPGIPMMNTGLYGGRKDDKVHGGKRRKLNTPVKNFDQVLSPGEILETRMEEGDPLYSSGTPSQTDACEGEDLSSKPKLELFNNNHVVRNNALGSDREVSSELLSSSGNGPLVGLNDNSDVIEASVPAKSDDVSSGVSVGDASEEAAASATALATAEEAAKRKLNELNMEKFAEFQEKMRQILKMNNVNFPTMNMGEGSPCAAGPANIPLDFSKFDPSSPAATAFAFAKLNAGANPFSPPSEKFDTSAAAVAAFNAASALAKGFGSPRMMGGKMDSSQEEMEDEFEYNEEEYEGDGERKGSLANSVHSDDGKCYTLYISRQYSPKLV